ncbi:MAG: acetylornithine/succinylornithine family transaminase [Brevinematales bacterium]|jgi:acetylornithine/N-succinyldiaminopimelate aminotransferase
MKDLIRNSAEFLIPFYSRTPIAIVSGHDHWVYDERGDKYLDLTSGIGVTGFGHSNRRINDAIKRQLDKISHISNLFIIPGQAELAEKICNAAFPGKLFFCNSGAEANEAALKMARIRGIKRNPGKSRVLSLSGSFHGRTIATISMTGQEKYRRGFEPLLPGVDFIGFNDESELEKKMGDDVCAVFLEAVQGEGGINPLSSAFIKKVRDLSKKFDFLIIFDEVQTGLGRTGRNFGYQNFDIVPDMITMAKALGNGFPIGAVLAVKDVAAFMEAGMHASTFGGNFLACAAGCAVMDELNSGMLSMINSLSEYFLKKLEELKGKYKDLIKENRIFGLMIGIELNPAYPVKDAVKGLLDSGILALRAGENVLRLLPPFTITRKEIDYFCEKLALLLETYSVTSKY